MRKLIMATIAVVTMSVFNPCLPAFASEKGDTLKACQADWKAEKLKPDFQKPAKGEGRAAYWSFVKACRPGKATVKASDATDNLPQTWNDARGKGKGRHG